MRHFFKGITPEQYQEATRVLHEEIRLCRPPGGEPHIVSGTRIVVDVYAREYVKRAD